MLQLKNITKRYGTTDNVVDALKGISLNFRKNEFVSILGPSGCGKTTMLNIVGGLDRYTSGDLIINGVSTKDYRDRDWDTYRNHSVGFVFQSYNLIPHMNVLDNVTLSLSLAGSSKAERIQKARAALGKVGLADQMKKRPNQLSGGQMQRVAIARAIVNDPDIILADEPTGALDSETGVQVMELLKEVARDRLVIMVTHNEELAKQYSTRIVKLFDGELKSDSMPYSNEEAEQAVVEQKEAELAQTEQQPKVKSKRKKQVSMSFLTAFGISAKSMFSKKGRTILTSFAGSIGIFGISLVLAASTGMTHYVDNMKTQAMGNSAITISETTMDMDSMMNVMGDIENLEEYPQNTSGVTPYKNPMTSLMVTNDISDEYVNHIKKIDASLVKAIDYRYGVKMNVLQQKGDTLRELRSWSSKSSQAVSNSSLIKESYEVVAGLGNDLSRYPENQTEIAVVVDKYNRLSVDTLTALGIDCDAENLTEVPYSEILGSEYKLILNDGWYVQSEEGGLFREIGSSAYKAAVESEHCITLKVVSVLRIKDDNSASWLSSGIVYLPELSQTVLQNAVQSNVGKAQIASTTKNVLNGRDFVTMGTSTAEAQYTNALKSVGAYQRPVGISIYPVDIEAKYKVNEHLDEWNKNNPDNKVVYMDFTALALDMMSTMIDVVTYMLVAFSAVSLIVSTVMISVITYTSVVERTKEIGVLRSIGARKKDIASIFNAETTLIGTFAGLIGIVFAAIVGAIVNFALFKAFAVENIVMFTPVIVIVMLALSVGLTLLAGLIPASIASNKDPVVALRTE